MRIMNGSDICRLADFNVGRMYKWEVVKREGRVKRHVMTGGFWNVLVGEQMCKFPYSGEFETYRATHL
jgi:hypothetical protein